MEPEVCREKYWQIFEIFSFLTQNMWFLFNQLLNIIFNQIECGNCDNGKFCNNGVCRENKPCSGKKNCYSEFGHGAICRKGFCFSKNEQGSRGMYIVSKSYNANVSHVLCLIFLARINIPV